MVGEAGQPQLAAVRRPLSRLLDEVEPYRVHHDSVTPDQGGEGGEGKSVSEGL